MLRKRVRRDSEAQPQGAPTPPPGATSAPEAQAPAVGAAAGPDAPGVDPLPDVWAQSRALAGGGQGGATREQTQLATDYASPNRDVPGTSPVALPLGVDAQPSNIGLFAGLGPKKAPHFKDVPVPQTYNGSVQGWLDWSTSIWRFLAARDPRWARPSLGAAARRNRGPPRESRHGPGRSRLGAAVLAAAWHQRLQGRAVF